MKKKSNNKNNSFRLLFSRLKGKVSLIVLSIIFSFIGVFLYTFASIAFGQIVESFFAPNKNISDYPLIKFMTFGSDIFDDRAFILCVVWMLVCYIVYSVSWALQNVLMINISQKTSASLRMEVFQKLQKMPVSYYEGNSSGDLMSRLTNDIDNISQALTQSLSQFIQSIIIIFVSLVLMFVMSSFMSLITIFLLPLLMSACFIFVKKAQPHFIKQQEKIGKLNGYIEEYISGQRVVSLYNNQEDVLKNFNKFNNDLVDSGVKSQTYSGFIFPWISFITNILLLIVSTIAVAFFLKDIHIGGLGGFVLENGKFNTNVSSAFFLTFTLLLRNVINPISQLLSTANVIQSGMAGATRVFEIINLKPREDALDAKELKKVKGHVVFKDVDFGYTEKKLNLVGANIEAKPGEVVAIVGPTGAGKTTIINVLTRFYEYNKGQIFIDDNEIRTIKEKSWRDNISIVLQDTFLFNGTIKENIRYGNLKATDKEIEDAAKLANAHEFIIKLEHGYDTMINSSDNSLSQGQRQLLAIARAVIAKSNVLILDEATSSVDTRTEIQIQNAMMNLMKGRTSFVIAHRLSTIKNANQILVVIDGKIVERGNHSELLKIKNGFYANLYNSQFKKGIVE